MFAAVAAAGRRTASLFRWEYRGCEREAARLGSLPRNYEFCGTRELQAPGDLQTFRRIEDLEILRSLRCVPRNARGVYQSCCRQAAGVGDRCTGGQWREAAGADYR